MTTVKRVALVIETSNEYARGLLHGIRQYIRKHESWSIFLGEHSRGHTDVSWLRTWRGDGIIARIENATVAKAVLATRLPAVDLSASRLAAELPMVETDDRAFADLAVTHLIDRGLKSFAFVGDDQFVWSRHRERAFVDRLRHKGFACSTYPPPRRSPCWAWPACPHASVGVHKRT